MSSFPGARQPAVGQAGFDLTRLDEEPEAGLIDNAMLVQIRTSRFVIAELSETNAGVYWEAGFAEGISKPVIYTCREDQKPHFDTSHRQTVFWDPDKLDDAALKLKSCIRATLPDIAKMTDG
ncbi:MAG: hypothetical protein GY930_10945 [bacterium]|nr:hypothetical protein [bacterium]